jgi:glucose/mannose-6-phosphate isomerase
MEIKKESLDSSNMRKMILDFPRQFKIGANAAKKVFLKSNTFLTPPENIIICGMGGSALPGDLLVTLRPLDVFVHKSYGLPPQAGIDSLVICISYSGNTEETLSAFTEAVSKRLPVMAITTGGKLARLCKKHKVPAAIIPPPYIPPRLALGFQFAALLQILTNHNLLPKNFIEEILKYEKTLNSLEFEEKAKKIAKKIYQKIPIIYSPKQFRALSLIWKNSLNETAKILAFDNYFPELNHNETVGFWKINETQISNKELLVIILRDLQDHTRILKQMKITKDIIEKEGIQVEFVNIQGKTTLEKIFSTIILGFWTSYCLALEYEVDPTPVKTIEELKRRLKEE